MIREPPEEFCYQIRKQRSMNSPTILQYQESFRVSEQIEAKQKDLKM